MIAVAGASGRACRVASRRRSGHGSKLGVQPAVLEKAARRVAADRAPRVTGILGVPGEAATRRLVEVASVIDRLRMTNFRSSPALLKAALDRFGTR